MSKVLEIREKRAKLWDQTKAFLDNAKRDGDVLTAEDVATYEKMESDIVAMGREIEMLERANALDLELNKPINTPITSKPNAGIDTKNGRASDEYKSAFWKSMKNKTSYDVINALQIGTDTEGGFLVPDEFEQTLIDGLQEENIMRVLSTVISTSFGDKKIPVVASHGTADWTDEEADSVESDDSFGMITLGAHKLTTILKVSEELLNDSVFNLENYIAKEFIRRISAAEENAFIIGNGVGKPTGILNATNGAELGVTTASATAITADEIIDLFHSLKAPYRKKATFITNDSTIKAIRKLKDGSGQYLWQASLQAGQPDTILNRPIKTASSMPTIEASAKIIAFGDLSYYWIADRQGRAFQRLNELFAKSGQIGFKVSQRVDGRLTLPESIKLLQMKS